MMDKIAILINTCDSYSDAWPLFFRILEKTWPECRKYKIYLNTEQKDYKDTFFDINILNVIPSKEKIGWGERLIDSLNRIDSEIILFLLEDFFFEEPVNDEKISNIIEWMEQNKNMAALSLTSTYDVGEDDGSGMFGYVLRKKKVHYTLNASPTLYRKETLLKYTDIKDNPWEWEFFGSIRTWHSKKEFYAKATNTEEIFKYDIKRGGAIHRGKWVGCTVTKLLVKYGLEADLSTRGVIDDWLKCNPEKPKRTIFTISKNKYMFVKNYIKSFKLK